MDFAALQVFKAVVDEGGIAAAARKLHRVQSNVTTRIRQLEASLGTPLFFRKNRRLLLAPAGELFLGYVDQMLELSREARDALLGDVPRGVLRIGTLESTAASRLPPLLTRYHDKYPGVRVELTTGTTGALVEAVSSRRLEAAFAADCAAVGPLDTMTAFQEELVVIAPRSHPSIRRAQDVRADSLISFAKGCAYRERLQAWLGTGGVVAEKVLELSSYHAIIACVAAGAGIAVVPRSVLATTRLEAGVAVYPLAGKMGKSTTSLVWRKGEGSAALAALQAEVMAVRKRGRASR